MNLTQPVIVLGAGASRGARLKSRTPPPTDIDFLVKAEEICRHKRLKGPNAALSKTWQHFQSSLAKARIPFAEVKSWRLEQLATFLEARANLKGLQLGQGQPRDYSSALEDLKNLVGHVLREAGGDEPCELHKMLFAKVNPLAVVSFNYDLIADQSLVALGRLNWSNRRYGGNHRAKVPGGRNKPRFQVIRRRRIANATPLLKLHGSIHWEKLARGSGFRLCGCTLPGGNGKGLEFRFVPRPPFIVPPVAAKVSVKDGALRELWRFALDELKQAKSWIIWGYSFPPTDTNGHILFRTALENHKRPKPVYVINPDAVVKAQVENICRGRVKVRQFPSIETFLLELGALVEKGLGWKKRDPRKRVSPKKAARERK